MLLARFLLFIGTTGAWFLFIDISADLLARRMRKG